VAAASHFYSGTKYFTHPADPAREDDGLFGPGSVTWRLMNNRVMWVAGFRSLYLQGLHPRVMRASWQNSSFTDPQEAWGRLFRTRMFVLTRTYGTTAEAEREGRRVRKIHESVAGTEPDGTAYRIDEPGLLLWVHCGEVSSFVDVARRSGLSFSAADLDTFADEQRGSAELVGLDPATVPASVAELDAYYEQIRPSLSACEEAMAALRLTIHPPVPAGNHAMKLALPRFNAFAFSTLPRWAREMYGRPGGPLTGAMATAGLRATRLALDRDLVFRAMMRAVQRAEGRR
jgi:uncharacterized protein (DUF2236 family)